MSTTLMTRNAAPIAADAVGIYGEPVQRLA